MSLVWDASPSSGVSGYKLYYQGNGQSNARVITVGNALAASVTALNAGLPYTFFVTAYDSHGLESTPSPTVTFASVRLGPLPNLTFIENGMKQPVREVPLDFGPVTVPVDLKWTTDKPHLLGGFHRINNSFYFRSSGSFGTGRITLTARDSQGNTSIRFFTVTINRQ